MNRTWKAWMRIGAIVFVVLVLLGTGGLWYLQRDVVSQSLVQGDAFTQVVAVQQGNLSATISVVGELDAVQNQTLAFDRIDGTTTLLTLEVAPGHAVAAGQVLATIDPSPYQQAFDQAQTDLQSAESHLADLQTPATDLELAQADLAIAQSNLTLQQAQADLDDLVNPDLADLQAQVTNAQLEVSQAQADLAELESDRSAEETLSRLQDTEAERAAEYSRLANETYSDVYYQDRLRLAYNSLMDAQDARVTAAVQQQMDRLNAQMRVRQAKQTLVDAQDTLTTAQAGTDELQLAAAQQKVAKAEADLAQARASRDELAAGPDPVDLAAAKADVVKKELAVEEAKADLAAATLRAPFAGTILQTDANAGDRITASSPILTLANLDELQVVASVDETTIRQVTAGQPVQITFDAFPGQRFQGQVLSVPLQGELQGGVMVYAVPISLEGAEALPLLVGMTANAEIQVGRAENALLVPTMALQEVGGSYRVLVPNSSDPAGTPQAVPVEVGISNGTYSQIVRGLNPGDQVLVEMQPSNANSDMRAFGQMMGGGNGRRSRPND